MSIITSPIGSDYPFGMNADVSLTRTSASGIQLAGVYGSSGRIFIRDVVIDCNNPLVIYTNSSNDYIITGTSVVTKGGAFSTLTSGYSDYSLLYVYLCNYSACWNFSGYNRQGQLIISSTAPQNSGYMYDYGDGANARHVGWVTLNTSRQMDHNLSIASVFNPIPQTVQLIGTDAGWTGINTGSNYYTTIPGCSTRIIVPINTEYDIKGSSAFYNDHGTLVAVDLRTYVDSSLKHIGWLGNVNNAGGYTRLGTSHTFFNETVTSGTSIKLIELKWLTSGGGAPQYYGPFSYLQIDRKTPSQQSGFTRNYTSDYESIARTTNGGRLEYVSTTSLEWQPHTNGSIGLYNGLNWVICTPSTNPSLANNATTISGAALTYDKNYDIFARYISETSLTLEAQEWATNTGRYTVPSRFQGILVENSTTDLGRQRRFLGTVRLINSSGAKFVDSETRRYVSNYYNRKQQYLYLFVSGGGTTFNSLNLALWTNWASPGIALVICDTAVINVIGEGQANTTSDSRRPQYSIYYDGAISGDSAYNGWDANTWNKQNSILSTTVSGVAGYHYFDFYKCLNGSSTSNTSAQWGAYLRGTFTG